MGQPLETHIRELQEFYWSERDPDGRGFVPLADALRKAGDFVEAHRVLREGLRRHPDFISGHVVAGWLSLDRGSPEEAEAQFRAALDLDSKNIAALRALGDILLERGDGLAALEVLEQLSHEDPIDLDLPRQIADLRLQTETDKDDTPDQDGEPDPTVWDDPYAVADELDWDGATLQPDESPGDDPGREEGDEVPGEAGDERLQSAMITSTLGELYLRQGLLDQAEEVFRTLLKADPESAHLQQRLEEARALKRGEGGSGEGERPDPPADEGALEPGSLPGASPEEDQFLVEPMPPGVVPIESLAPDRVFSRPSEGLSDTGSAAPDEPISIDALAPDEPMSIDALAPDEPISIDALAPDEPLPVAALAPDEPISIDALAPDEPLPVAALAPDEPTSIDALAPDEPEGDSNMGAFERWLDNLK